MFLPYCIQTKGMKEERERKKERKSEKSLRRRKLEDARAKGKRTDRVCGFETSSHEETLLGIVVHAVFVENEAHSLPCLQKKQQ